MKLIIKIIIVFFSIVFIYSIAHSNTISNCSNCGSVKKKSSIKNKSKIFAENLGKVKPKDPFFHLKRIKLNCENKNGKILQKTLMGYISSEYFYAVKSSKDIALIIVGYVNKENNKLIIQGIEHYFPKNSKTSYNFEYISNENIFNALSNNIEGTNTWKDKCFITSKLKWGGDYVAYVGKNFTLKEEKIGLNRAINTLKMLETTQYDLSQTLAQNGFILGFKFELSDLMTDLTMKLAKLDIQTKIIIKEDTESKRIADQKSKELEKEKALRIAEEKERKILEAKTKQIAIEKQRKIEEERALRKAEVLKRKKAEERAVKIALEKKLAEEKAKKEAKNRALKLAEERKKTEEVAKKLEQEILKAELKTKKLEKAQQIQLAALEKEKDEKQKLILDEKKKREELEKKLASLREENKKKGLKSNSVQLIKLPPEWEPYKFDLSPQQRQFCQLTNRFFKDMDKAINSANEIKINILHRDRQQNLDGLLPGGKVNNWIFQIVKIDQVEDGSAAVVLSLQCKSFVGSGQVHTKSSWRKKSNKEWRATIPYNDRRFRELAKLDKGQFILGSGTLLEINAFKPGQIETFYASQQVGEHPLTKGLNLEGELFLADLTYIAALN